MSPSRLPSASASERTATRGTRPRRTNGSGGSTAPDPVRKPRTLRPFTLAHFRWWSSLLVLDDGTHFVLEGFEALVVADILARTRGGGPLFAEVWDIVPEGNGKSTLIAIVALYFAEFQPFAAIPVAAASREQAEIIYRQAEGFVLRTPRLHELVDSELQRAKGKRKTDLPRFVCLEGYRRINHVGGGRIQVFAADDRTGDGIVPTLCIVDEPHRQRDLALYRTWTGKLLKRGGQIVAISTSGEPGSDFELTREKIRQSAVHTTTKGSFSRYEAAGIVLHEWALAEDADPEDFAAVKAANPFSRITIGSLREKYNRPTMTLEHWLRFVCNRPQRSQKSAITESEWLAARSNEPIPPGVPIWLGLDVAWKWDTTSAVPLWWRDIHYRLFGPAEVLEPPRDGTSLDPHAVESALLRIHQRNPVHTVVMDISRAEQLAVWIEETLGSVVVDRAQSNQWAVQDYDLFMEALRSRWLWHSGDPDLTTHALNAIARALPGGETRFDRPNSSRGDPSAQNRRVIDGLTAASMVNSAAAIAAAQPTTPKRANSGWV